MPGGQGFLWLPPPASPLVALSPAHSLWRAGPGAQLPARAPIPGPRPPSPLLDLCGPVWTPHEEPGSREGKGPHAWPSPAHPGPGPTYRRVHVQVLHLLLKSVHYRRDLLQVHGAEGPVQGFGHLRHVLGHLAEAGVRRQAGPSGPPHPRPRHGTSPDGAVNGRTDSGESLRGASAALAPPLP